MPCTGRPMAGWRWGLWEEFLEAVGRADLLEAADEVVRAELDKLLRTSGVDEWQGLALEHSLALEKVRA